MAGADESGEEMQTGRTNRAEDRTILWAQVQPGDANFNGPAILIVEVAKDADDPDDYEDGDTFIPSNAFDGIVATGWSGGSASNFGGTPGGGVGVIGNGGRNQGTGVLGVGSGFKGPGSGNGGSGGIGVQGIGGSQAAFFIDPTVAPGAGVVGQGGRQDANGNTLRLPHAAGVIALGGGEGLPLPPLMDTGSVGAWAQGANAEMQMVHPSDETGTIPGPDVPSGPLAPGAGVFGRGGVPIPPRGPVAAGVIGLAGGTAPIPDISETGNTGVYGAGPTGVFGHGPIGVRGQGDSGAGVEGYGSAKDSRGGQFESTRAAQVWLVPHETREPSPPTANVAATALVTKGERGTITLPKDGRGGDLLTLMDDKRQCTLWFCVQGSGSGPAQWAQVLLGPAFAGVA